MDGVPERRFEDRSIEPRWEQFSNVEGITPVCKFDVLVYVTLQLSMIEYDNITSSS